MATVEQQRMLKDYERRQEMREQYEKDRMKEVSIKADKKHVYGKEDMLNLPRHQVQGKCRRFQECRFDYKCRAYDPTYIQCQRCVLHETNGICHKKEIHTERAHSVMISRERIDLDAKDDDL